LTFVTTNGRLPPDTYTVSLRSAANGVRDTNLLLLDGNADGTAGDNFVRTFVVTAPAANAVTVSIPNFARGPQQAIHLPASGVSGVPISFSDGGGLTSASFELRYDPALLTISSAAVAPGMPPGATVNLNIAMPGVAVVQFASPTPLPVGTTRFVDLQASVPGTATYRTKQVLDLANIVLNTGSIPGLDDDGVQVVAYFGDTTGNGTYTAGDASRTMRLTVGLDSGLELYKLLDPTMIADINGNNAISSTDTSRLLQVAVAFNVPEIPPLPNPAVSLIQGGPDPKLSIPSNLVAATGGTLQVPVLIDSIVDLTGTGLESADLVLYYDPAVLDITGVMLGSLVESLAGGSDNWFVASNIDPLAGRIFISLAGTVPLEGVFQGELVQLQAEVKENSPLGATAINLAASSRDPSRFTQLNEGYLTLIPAPTDAANDSIDGLITVVAASPLLPSPTALMRLVGDRLLVLGTNSHDRIFIGRLDDHSIAVRVNANRPVRFPVPTEIEFESFVKADQVNVERELRDRLNLSAPGAEVDLALFQWLLEYEGDDQPRSNRQRNFGRRSSRN
jgi:hypothetical protein